jgi:hypothetical protein
MKGKNNKKVKGKRSLGEKQRKNKKRVKMYEKQKKQAKDVIWKIKIWFCVVSSTPVLMKVIWLSRSYAACLTPRMREAGSSSNLIR